jgi:type I restriction enzyme S subunit
MTQTWQSIKLSKVLTKSNEWIDIDLSQSYKQVTVKMWGKGVELRSEVLGTEISASKRLQVHPEQFILSRIDARHGAFGLIPNSLNLAVVTNDFPVFNLNRELLLPDFLNWLSKTADFVDICRLASEGTTNRVRLKEDKFLSTEIRLPPIAEQRRIVARIEELAAKIEEARGLRESAIEKATLLTKASLDDIFSKSLDSPEWSLINLNSVTEIARGKFTHRPRNDPRFYGGEIPFIQIGDISGSNRYIQNHTQTLNDEGLKVSRLFPIGTVVIAITGATVGATGILTFELAFPDSIVGIIPQEELVIPEFIYWSLEFFKQIALDEAKQTTQPNINLKILNKLKIPLPSIEVQKEIVSYLDDVRLKVDQITQLRENALKEFDALLPAILDKAFKGEL